MVVNIILSNNESMKNLWRSENIGKYSLDDERAEAKKMRYNGFENLLGL